MRKRAFRITPRVRRLLVVLIAAAAMSLGRPSIVRAQAAAPIPTIEFDDAIARALAKNPTVAEAATNIARAEALLEQAQSATRPTVSASATNSTLNTGVVFSGLVAQPRSQTTFAARAAMPILAAAGWAAVSQARDEIDVAQLSVAETRRDVAVSAAQAYLAIVAAKRQVDVEERAIGNAQAHDDYARKRLEGGAGSRLNEVRAAQDVSAEQVRLENARLALIDSQEAFGVLLAQDGPMDTGAEPAFDVPAPGDESTWLAARADVRLDTAMIAAAKRVVADSWKDWLPTGTVSFSPQIVTPAGIFQQSRTWQLLVSFTQPVFDSGARKAAAALRGVTFDQATLQLTSAEIQARSEVRVAMASLTSNQRALDAARQSSDQANQVLQITTAAFEVGATTNVEVIDAQRAARDAETAAAQAEDSVRHARLDLLIALGRFPK